MKKVFTSTQTDRQTGMMANLVLATGLNRFLSRSVPPILTVDYSQSLEQMIAIGGYDRKSDRLTAAAFPIRGAGIVRYEPCLFSSRAAISSEEVIDLIKQEDEDHPWEPAAVEHLLAFGISCPNIQRKVHVVAPAAISIVKVDNWYQIPYLSGGTSHRSLCLTVPCGDWNPIACQFLAVRKIS